MPLTVNTNTSATTASFQLSAANDALRKSLARLSSGNRIVSPADDAGGLSVASKMASKLKRTAAVGANIQNGISYLQVQDGTLASVAKILDRMAELRTMAQDVTKNPQDIENYSKEFIELQRQLQQVKNETFNGISLFADNTANSIPTLNKASIANDEGVLVTRFSRTLYTNASGQATDGNVSIGVINLQYVLSLGSLDHRYLSDGSIGPPFTNVQGLIRKGLGSENGFINLGNINEVNNDDFGGYGGPELGPKWWSVPHPWAFDQVYTSDGFLNNIMLVSVGQFTTVIERLADVRAENGAEQQRLNLEIEGLRTNQVNLEAAHGRIMDADVALESTRFARQNVLVQSSAAMVAQANQLTDLALRLMAP
jgi:flagellin